MVPALTRRGLVSAAPAAAVAGALPALAASVTAAVASHDVKSSKLQALGKAWALNLEQQKAAEAACKAHAAMTAAYRQADARWTALMADEVELSHAMWAEPASTPDDLAVKARVILRAIGLTLSGTAFADPARIPPADARELDEEQGIAASLALDLLRLAGTAVGKGGADA